MSPSLSSSSPAAKDLLTDLFNLAVNARFMALFLILSGEQQHSLVDAKTPVGDASEDEVLLVEPEPEVPDLGNNPLINEPIVNPVPVDVDEDDEEPDCDPFFGNKESKREASNPLPLEDVELDEVEDEGVDVVVDVFGLNKLLNNFEKKPPELSELSDPSEVSAPSEDFGVRPPKSFPNNPSKNPPEEDEDEVDEVDPEEVIGDPKSDRRKPPDEEEVVPVVVAVPVLRFALPDGFEELEPLKVLDKSARSPLELDLLRLE